MQGYHVSVVRQREATDHRGGSSRKRKKRIVVQKLWEIVREILKKEQEGEKSKKRSMDKR